MDVAFTMQVRRPNGTTASVSSADQQRPTCAIYADSLVFRWSDLKIANSATRLDATFTGVIKFNAREGLLFTGNVSNNSDYRIETLNWPIVSDISIPKLNDKLLFRYLSYSTLKTIELYPHLDGYYTGGCNLPEQAFATIGNEQQGVYLSSKDSAMKEYIRLNYEVLPSADYNKALGTISGSKNSADKALLKYQIYASRNIFVSKGDNYRMVEVAMQPYVGNWQIAADIYKQWRTTWFQAPHRPEWVKQVNAWQQLQINSSESNINFQVKDLVSYAQDCKKFGVKAIQLTGWNWGGQDRGIPCHDLDPRLGTREEFRKAIATCQAMGVNIMLFTKFTWIELTAPWYNDFKPYIAKDADGEACYVGGYRYNTYTQLMSFANRRFGILCFLDDHCRALLKKEFKKCLDLGAAGMVYDENQHHSGTHLCYDPTHGHKVADYVFRGDQLLGREFYEMTRKYSPEFLMTGEGPYDNQGQYYATYTRATVDHSPLMRYIDPELPIVCAVTDHFDKNRVNMCLMNRYIISYEPRNFKGRLGEFPRIMEYGKKVDDLRRQYSDYLWDATFNSTLGATVTGTDIIYGVLARKTDGKRAVVILNKSTDNAREATIDL
ncbi:MAG: DUF6259 domain-containing protein, partial [Alistipes sp.]